MGGEQAEKLMGRRKKAPLKRGGFRTQVEVTGGIIEEAYPVHEMYNGWRLDRFLVARLNRSSRTQVALFIQSGVYFDDGRKVKAGTRVREGDVVRVRRQEKQTATATSIDGVRVLHEDPYMMVLDKPAGILVHRTARELSNTVTAWLEREYPGERIEAAHRIDRETSGCLVCGRGVDAIRALRTAFADNRVAKTYRAVVVDPDRVWSVGDRVTEATPLGPDATSSVRLRIGAGTLPCASHIHCLSRNGEYAHLEIAIDQGRQHQIRAHLFMRGTPIAGDKLYEMGDEYFDSWSLAPDDPALLSQLRSQSHCLHALRVVVPGAEGELRVSADLPQRILALCAADAEGAGAG